MLVEDDEINRLLAAEALRDADCLVDEAMDAAQALMMLQAQAHSFRALVTDITMPGVMDGLALAHEVARSWPWIGVVLVSGRPRPSRADMPPNGVFLSKPYTHQTLTINVFWAAERRRSSSQR